MEQNKNPVSRSRPVSSSFKWQWLPQDLYLIKEELEYFGPGQGFVREKE
jgi:hypothetical protein